MSRIRLDVWVDLDPVPGQFHTAESAKTSIGIILLQRIPHYNPVVSYNHDLTKQHHTPEAITPEDRLDEEAEILYASGDENNAHDDFLPTVEEDDR